jgi:hypothetical protein
MEMEGELGLLIAMDIWSRVCRVVKDQNCRGSNLERMMMMI